MMNIFLLVLIHWCNKWMMCIVLIGWSVAVTNGSLMKCVWLVCCLVGLGGEG